ncbi:hypothetical protein GCM10007172_35620 [Sinomonas atrocyanea]|nr:hypothetical protein GCM10007172_35620 [Sinomonas atrocyanea]
MYFGFSSWKATRTAFPAATHRFRFRFVWWGLAVCVLRVSAATPDDFENITGGAGAGQIGCIPGVSHQPPAGTPGAGGPLPSPKAASNGAPASVTDPGNAEGRHPRGVPPFGRVWYFAGNGAVPTRTTW